MSDTEKKSNIASIIKYFEDIKSFSDSGISLFNTANTSELDTEQLFEFTVKIQDAIEEIRDLIFNLEE